PGLKLKVVSDKALQLDGVQVENNPWRLATEQANLASFDIGIMPLWDSVWTRGKCGYKILQYMGVGTAVVASDVGVNNEIISSGDAVVISVPKSGRTWVRTFLCAYFCKRTGRPFTLRPDRYHEPDIPRMIFSYDFAEQRMKATLWERVRGKYLVPARELARAHVILLVRDPRDAFVSLYMQLVHRTRETPQELKEKSIGDLLRDRRFGIMSIIKTMNNWFAEFARREDFTLLHYESLRAAPEKNFRNLLSTLGETSP